MKLIVYTALFADKNLPIEDVGKFYPFEHDKEDVKYIAYTNRDDLTSDYWEVRKIDGYDGLSSRMMAREIKWNPTKYLEDFTHSLWLDSQCYFTFEPKAIVTHYLQDIYHTAIHHHTDLQSIYVEGMVSSYVYSNDIPSIINRQLERYFKEGHPYNYDHYETGVLIRENCNASNQLSRAIYNELTNHSIRDQICTPYCVRNARELGDDKILTIKESFTAHKGGLPLPKSQIFFTTPKPSEKLKENLNERNPTE